MALYMSLFSYTAETWANLVKNPQDRREVLSAAAQKVGGRLVSLHYCFGEYDGVAIYEAPNDITAAAIAIAAAAPGHLKSIQTTRLLTVEETIDALRQAGTIGYQAPRS